LEAALETAPQAFMMKDVTTKYSNGEITVVWKPGRCQHSAICFRGLPEVFDPRVRPWIRPEHATTQQIVNQVEKCPSGALSFFRKDSQSQQSR